VTLRPVKRDDHATAVSLRDPLNPGQPGVSGALERLAVRDSWDDQVVAEVRARALKQARSSTWPWTAAWTTPKDTSSLARRRRHRRYPGRSVENPRSTSLQWTDTHR
jgi:hypothetical protein